MSDVIFGIQPAIENCGNCQSAAAGRFSEHGRGWIVIQPDVIGKNKPAVPGDSPAVLEGQFGQGFSHGGPSEYETLAHQKPCIAGQVCTDCPLDVGVVEENRFLWQPFEQPAVSHGQGTRHFCGSAERAVGALCRLGGHNRVCTRADPRGKREPVATSEAACSIY